MRSGRHAILVCVGLGRTPEPDCVDEFSALARSAGAQVLELLVVTRRAADPRYLLGSGKVSELSERVAAQGADLVLVDHELSPSQERNLERELKCRVLDRSGLILDIFAQRARSFEGKLQVELAQLEHLSTRLVRGWTHLERQKGGIGLRGPGETHLETDRRLVGRRIKTLNDRLDRVLVQRDTTRRERQRGAVPTVAVVGYTNAGKSTLFNRLTAADAYAADQLFATLATGRAWVVAERRCARRPGGCPGPARARGRLRSTSRKRATQTCCCTSSMRGSGAPNVSRRSTTCSIRSAPEPARIAIYNKIDRTARSRASVAANGRRSGGCRRRPARVGLRDTPVTSVATSRA
jgi:hypothetical protein